MQQFKEVSRTRTIYSTETHTSDFILNTFWNGKPVQFFQERCWVVVMGCQENKSCSKVLNFQESLVDRIRCTHEETVAVVKPWKDVGSNKSLGCVFSEKPADWTNAFKLEISSLTFLWLASSWTGPSQVPGRMREDVVEPRVSGLGRKTMQGFKEDKKGKRRAFVLPSLSLNWFSVIHVFMSSVHASSSLVRLVTSLRGADCWSCVSFAKSWWFTEWSRWREWAPVLSPEAHRTWAVMVTKTSYWLKWTDTCLRGMSETTGVQ